MRLNPSPSLVGDKSAPSGGVARGGPRLREAPTGTPTRTPGGPRFRTFRWRRPRWATTTRSPDRDPDANPRWAAVPRNPSPWLGHGAATRGLQLLSPTVGVDVSVEMAT